MFYLSPEEHEITHLPREIPEGDAREMSINVAEQIFSLMQYYVHLTAEDELDPYQEKIRTALPKHMETLAEIGFRVGAAALVQDIEDYVSLFGRAQAP